MGPLRQVLWQQKQQIILCLYLCSAGYPLGHQHLNQDAIVNSYVNVRHTLGHASAVSHVHWWF